ncbi:unnamed protein product [Clonostachys rosea f. rosea IK726]|uniref:Uncharacterized protein n=1 Tax=Clonostachys rosea f. rosea IK726 TaxID=1349383 RepID=A0ACA9UCT1_BIOOC|nr:unnamed protein product [Clonostachys rosea f. rosea IK726]
MAAALSYQSLFSTLRYESTKAVVGFFVAYVDDVFEDKAQELSRAMMARPGPQRSLVLTEDRQPAFDTKIRTCKAIVGDQKAYVDDVFEVREFGSAMEDARVRHFNTIKDC